MAASLAKPSSELPTASARLGSLQSLSILPSQNLQLPARRSLPKRLGIWITQILAPGSTFGTYFRVTTFGESHGGGVGCVIDGCPPRIPLTEADLQVDLDRRGNQWSSNQGRSAQYGSNRGCLTKSEEKPQIEEKVKLTDATLEFVRKIRKKHKKRFKKFQRKLSGPMSGPWLKIRAITDLEIAYFQVSRPRARVRAFTAQENKFCKFLDPFPDPVHFSRKNSRN